MQLLGDSTSAKTDEILVEMTTPVDGGRGTFRGLFVNLFTVARQVETERSQERAQQISHVFGVTVDVFITDAAAAAAAHAVDLT